MLSISARGSASSAEQYYDHLADEHRRGGPEDYYTSGKDQPGQWFGAGAEALGLTGAVSREQFGNALRGRDTQGTQGRDLVHGAGDQHRAGWDLTFSVPKSVSLAWAMAPDEGQRAAIQAAHDRAVAAALQHVQEHCITARRGKGGIERESASMVAAVFAHGTSREQDPQLHSHCMVMNLAQRQDGSWGGIESRDLYQWKMASGAIYRAELASQMRQLGFEVEQDRDAFRLAAVPRQAEAEFSTRRQQIEAALQAHGASGAKASEVAALDTRRPKEHVSQSGLLADWQQRGAACGFGPEQAAQARQAEPVQGEPMPGRPEILRTLTETASTFRQADIFRAVATMAQGTTMGAAGVRDVVAGLTQDREIVRLRGADGSTRYSTREMIALERGMADGAMRRQHETAHHVSDHAIGQAMSARPTISDEQRAALEHITRQTGGVAVIEGMAGTGKSFLMGAAREAWEADGFQVRGAALAGKAAQGLEEGSGIQSQTLHSLLAALEPGPDGRARESLSARDVVVIDEAGMVGSRQMARLLDHIHRAGAKAVLIGDSRQLQPIDAGGAFRSLSQRLGAAELTDIRRQREDWARQAVHDFADGKAGAALTAYQERGLLAVGADRQDSMRQMVTDWCRERDPDRPGESLMLAGTRVEVRRLNELAREQMRAQHRLGPAAQIEGREFSEGERLLFTRNSAAIGVKNGTLGTLTRVDLDRRGEWQFTVRADSGEIVRFSPSAGAERGGYAHIDHGYAVSAHKAQGVTVDRAYVLVSETMSDREWSYVAASRSRDQTRIYTDEATMEDLADSMSRSRQADTTLDYLPDPEPAPEPAPAPEEPAPETSPAPTPEPEFELEDY
ncbi:MobF family relaxase [Thermithiobacillus plumbiphilus]|uniref:MobF family relaxase n=1 Tax=Thermithiobacillus plumbiphilus TaxID=1729899 RepID=A0ABU9D6W8_9PROT